MIFKIPVMYSNTRRGIKGGIKGIERLIKGVKGKKTRKNTGIQKKTAVTKKTILSRFQKNLKGDCCWLFPLPFQDFGRKREKRLFIILFFFPPSVEAHFTASRN